MRRLIIIMMLFVGVAEAKDKSNGLSVFISSQKSEAGLINPGAQDSVGDFEIFLKRKGYAIIQDEASADISIMVLNRGSYAQIVGSSTSVGRGIFGGLSATTVPVSNDVKCVMLRTKMRGEAPDEWYNCHSDIFYASWTLLADITVAGMDNFMKKNKEQIVKNRELEMKSK